MATASEMTLKSYIPSYQFSLKWEFENYSKYPKVWEKITREFRVEPESSWYVKFRKADDCSYLYLCRNKGSDLKAHCEVLILNCKNEVKYKENYWYATSGEFDLFCNAGYTAALKNPEDKFILNILITICDWKPFTEFVNLSPCATKVSVKTVEENRLETLSADLKKLFDNNVKTDVTFNIGGETLSAHKNILIARSEVFARMFQEGMTEEENSVVNIEDIDLTTMKIFLSFMYSAELEECDLDSVLKVYQAADKYLVPDLKDACAHSLAAKMTMDNVSKILCVAEMHHHEELKERAMQFIARHHKLNQTVLREKS